MGETEDRFLGGRILLRQPDKGHRAGTDALLLAQAALPFSGKAIADFGAGTGLAGIACAVNSGTDWTLSEDSQLALVEIDPETCRLAAANLIANRVQGVAINCDIAGRPAAREAAGLRREAFDLVIMNPPFYDSARMRRSADPARALAHAMPDAALAKWFAAARHHLKSKGVLALIHRADAIGLVLDGLKGFGGIALRFVHPQADAPAIRLLLTAAKGSRSPLRVLPPLVLHEADGRFTPEAAAMHNGTTAQPAEPGAAVLSIATRKLGGA
jgi:tRNA1(Val) A37 N6-methylase TrmN6